MELKTLIQTLHPLERQVLPFLKESKTLTSLIQKSNLKEVEVMRALQWLENKEILKLTKKTTEIISWDKNGEIYLKKGLPEKIFLNSINHKTTLKDIKEKTDLSEEEINISLGILRKKLAITIEPPYIIITGEGKKLLEKETLEEKFLKKLPLQTSQLTPEDKYAYEELKKRKQIIKTELKKEREITLTKLGEKLIKEKIETKNIIDKLTPEIIRTSAWKNKDFRRYDIKINVPRVYPGKQHIINQAISYIKRIWLDLGFKETTGNLLDTSFWNFDALFTPQDHPARDLQDTFYIKDYKGKIPKELALKIRKTHEDGYNTGSKGWQYKWDEEKAKEFVLRTHTTILSAKTLSNLKQTDLPAKFFTVGKVFRNETIDWKHSFEFYQVEGIVVDENANFQHLLGYLKEYYSKLGFEKIRFRPAYFPYTEMSVEPIAYIPEKKEWIELGGAGIFRPEVVKPLLGRDIPVLAWGQGLERGIMDYYKIKDLRQLYNNDIKLLKEIKIWK